MNMYLVEISICILCFNKYDQNKIIKQYIFNWLIINFLLCFIWAEPSCNIILYFVFENKYYKYYKYYKYSWQEMVRLQNNFEHLGSD